MVCTEPQMFPHFDIKVVASVPFSLKEEMIFVVVLQLHQVSSKSDENKKSFHYRPFNGSVDH